MNLIIAIVLSLLLATCRAVPLECNLIGPKSATLRLRRHLFCEYDETIRPVLRKDSAVNVTVGISPRFIDFASQTSTFYVHAWVFLNWKDEHLTWKPDDFDGVNRVRVKSDEIWVPDLSVYNSGDLELSQTGVPSTICQLEYDGNIICIPSIKYNTQCDTDYSYWPYDKQECTIRLGSWTHTGEEIGFNFRRKSVNMVNYTPHKQWQLTNYTAKKFSPKFNCCPNDTFPTLVVKFMLQRHASMIQATFVTPAIALMVITLTVLWLDSGSVERISLASVNFICHMLCIYNLSWMLPSNGYKTPHILLFYRDSMVLATFAMIITTILRKIQSTKASAPNWIVTTVAFVASNRAGRFLLLDNDAETKELANSSDRDVEDNIENANVNVASVKTNLDNSWRKLAVIVEWLSFFVAAFTYALLVILLIPMSEPELRQN